LISLRLRIRYSFGESGRQRAALDTDTDAQRPHKTRGWPAVTRNRNMEQTRTTNRGVGEKDGTSVDRCVRRLLEDVWPSRSVSERHFVVSCVFWTAYGNGQNKEPDRNKLKTRNPHQEDRSDGPSIVAIIFLLS